MALGLSDSAIGAGQSWNTGSAVGEEVQDGGNGEQGDLYPGAEAEVEYHPGQDIVHPRQDVALGLGCHLAIREEDGAASPFPPKVLKAGAVGPDRGGFGVRLCPQTTWGVGERCTLNPARWERGHLEGLCSPNENSRSRTGFLRGWTAGLCVGHLVLLELEELGCLL